MKGLVLFLKQMLFVFRTFRRYGHLLRGGHYRLYPSRRAIVHCNSKSIERADSYFSGPTGDRKLLFAVRLFNALGILCNRGSKGEYEAVYIANNYDPVRETKLFSFEQNKVLVFCVSPEAKEEAWSAYNQLNAFFSMPIMREMTWPNAYEVSLIRCLPRANDYCALENIAMSTTAFVKGGNATLSQRLLRNLLECHSDNAEEQAIIEEISAYISNEILDADIPLCMQHGDLSRDNLMYGSADGKETFWWIDWEHLAERPFAYDMFFYMLNSAVCSGNVGAAREFAAGQYDDILSDFFRTFGITYNKEDRQSWFMAFSMIILKERVLNRGYLNALKKYRNFLLGNFLQY